MARSFDAVVVGSGPGGYVAAIRLAQLGKKTAIVEKNPTFGGVCLNWGCIPSKAVIHAAELRKEIGRAAAFGIGSGATPPLELGKLRSWKQDIVKKLTGGLATPLNANGGEVLRRRGRRLGPTKLHVEGEDRATGGSAAVTREEVEAKAIVVATGARPIELPFLKGSRVWTSKELLDLEEIPRRIAIVGGGVI